MLAPQLHNLGGTIVLQQSKPHPTAAAASYTDRMPVHQATKLLLNAKLSQWKPPGMSIIHHVTL